MMLPPAVIQALLTRLAAAGRAVPPLVNRAMQAMPSITSAPATQAATQVVQAAPKTPAYPGYLSTLSQQGALTRPWPGVYQGAVNAGRTQPVSYAAPKTFEVAPLSDAQRAALLKSLGVQ